MSRHSSEGKQAWAKRATSYPEELRDQITQDAAKSFAIWNDQRRPPAWFRIKQIWERRIKQVRELRGTDALG